MSTTTSLSDTLPSSVPKLDATGTNWAVFYVRFKDAIDAKGYWGHFDGSSTHPVFATPTVVLTEAAETTQTVLGTPGEEQQVKINQWEKNERSSRSLLTQKIPDSTLMKIHSKIFVKERWDSIVKEYTEKGAYTQTELREKIQESRCQEKGNVCEFLENL